MPFDVRALDQFYESPKGQMARRVVLQRLRTLWPDLSRQRLLGFGFATPYLKPFAAEAERAVAAMPAQQGVMGWSATERSCATLVEEHALPFPNSAFDRILLVHGLELSEAERPFMRELWRVLTPDGRLLIVAPNRTSLWAQLETTPFGHGRPYSRGQLEHLLRALAVRAGALGRGAAGAALRPQACARRHGVGARRAPAVARTCRGAHR